jgi:hypothetical protein
VPILPVQIGEVASYRDDPIFAMQLVDYRNPGICWRARCRITRMPSWHVTRSRWATAVRGGKNAIDGVIFHTDRGSTYTASDFTALCRRLGIRQSMGRVGSCFDNAASEAFFSTLEHEVLSRHHFATALSRYIKYAVAQLIVELWRWISLGLLVFQAAASSAVTSRQTAKRPSISVRHWVALSRCLRGRKCAEMPLKADRNRWACRTDLKRFIARSRCRVG